MLNRHDATTYQVVTLTPERARWWVEGGPAAPDPEHLEAHIRDFLAAPQAGALLAVVEGERTIARMQACPVGTCGWGLFAAGFRDGLAEAEVLAAADVLLAASEALARQTPGVRYLETDVPSFAPLPAAWRDALQRRGIAAIATSHTYERALEAPEAPVPDGLSFRPVSELAPAVVEAVYAACYAETDDQSHRLSQESFAARLEQLKAIPLLAPECSGWRVAFEGDRPVGLVFVSIEAEPLGSPTTGWILEIGVVPEARGRRLSRTLLQRGLALLAERGVTRVRSRIDEANTPSVRLHLGAGFTRMPEPSWLHRRVW